MANGNFGTPINTFSGPSNGLDQPWIETGPANHVYVAYNDIAPATPGQTASILVSSDGGNTYKPFTLDRVGGTGPFNIDDPAVREAVNGTRSMRFSIALPTRSQTIGDGQQFDSQVVVVKSVNAGDELQRLGGGWERCCSGSPHDRSPVLTSARKYGPKYSGRTGLVLGPRSLSTQATQTMSWSPIAA